MQRSLLYTTPCRCVHGQRINSVLVTFVVRVPYTTQIKTTCLMVIASTRTGLHSESSCGHSGKLPDGFHNPNQHWRADMYAHLCPLMPEKKISVPGYEMGTDPSASLPLVSCWTSCCTHSAAHHQYLPFSQHYNDDKR